MVLIYIGVAFLAALAVALTVFSMTASLFMAILAYAATGTLVLCVVLVSAMLTQRDESNDPILYPAE